MLFEIAGSNPADCTALVDEGVGEARSREERDCGAMSQ